MARILFIMLFIIMAFASVVYGIDLDIIAEIESSNNPNAYNSYSGATGLYQITWICLNDYNILNHTDLRMQDMLDPDANYVVASWYILDRIPELLEYYGLKITDEAILACYNWGIGNYRKYEKDLKDMPWETVNYIEKYERIKNG